MPHKLDPRVKIIFQTPEEKHFFFGYYDISPFNMASDKLLAMHVNFINRLPCGNDIASIGYFDIQNNTWEKIDETPVFSWQLGCRLQWVGPDFHRYIIYNAKKDNSLISCVFDNQTKAKKALPLPIYAISPDGKWGLTFNFSRIKPGYGYAGSFNACTDEGSLENDGIFLLNLSTGKYRLLFSFAQLCRYHHINAMEDGTHWIELMVPNTNGSRFCFLHRWNLSDGGVYTRLFTANLNGTDLYCLLDSGMFSHLGWRNPKELLGWGKLPNALNQMRKNRWFRENILKFVLPMYHYLTLRGNNTTRRIANESYLLFYDKTADIKKIGTEVLREDGHCSWSPDGQWILTDTYPDKNHYRTLILYNFKMNERINIGKFYSLPNEQYAVDKDWEISAMRCDLHPRWDRNGRQVCIDSVHEGHRQMAVIDIKNIVS